MKIQTNKEDDGTLTLIFDSDSMSSVVNLDKKTKLELIRILIDEEIKEI